MVSNCVVQKNKLLLLLLLDLYIRTGEIDKPCSYSARESTNLLPDHNTYSIYCLSTKEYQASPAAPK